MGHLWPDVYSSFTGLLVSRTPFMRDVLHASTEMMGLILFGFSCGSMLGVLLAGKLVAHFGTSRVMRTGYLILLGGRC